MAALLNNDALTKRSKCQDHIWLWWHGYIVSRLTLLFRVWLWLWPACIVPTVTKQLHHGQFSGSRRALCNLLQVSLVTLTTHSRTQTSWRFHHLARRLGKYSIDARSPMRDQQQSQSQMLLWRFKLAPLAVRETRGNWLTSNHWPE